MAKVSLLHLGILLFIGLTVAMANGEFRLHCIGGLKSPYAYNYQKTKTQKKKHHTY